MGLLSAVAPFILALVALIVVMAIVRRMGPPLDVWAIGNGMRRDIGPRWYRLHAHVVFDDYGVMREAADPRVIEMSASATGEQRKIAHADARLDVMLWPAGSALAPTAEERLETGTSAIEASTRESLDERAKALIPGLIDVLQLAALVDGTVRVSIEQGKASVWIRWRAPAPSLGPIDTANAMIYALDTWLTPSV